mgnify:FL=1
MQILYLEITENSLIIVPHGDQAGFSIGLVGAHSVRPAADGVAISGSNQLDATAERGRIEVDAEG